MASTVQSLLDRVMREIGFAVPSTYASTQALALANRSATMLRTLPLTRRRATGTIAMTTATSYALPSDFFDYIPDTAYIEDNLNPVAWPIDVATWNQYKAGNVSPGATLFCRLIAGELAILNPIDGSNLLFEYNSNAVIQATGGGAYKQLFTLDTDEWLLDDELLTLDFRWRMKKEKGQDWQPEAAEAQAYIRGAIGRANGARTITPVENWPLAEPYANLWRP